MKKKLTLVLCTVLIVMLAVPVMAKDSSSAVTLNGEATKVVTAPKIDGVIDDIWAQATPYTIANFTDGAEDTGVRATFKVLWDSDNLYVLFEVPDATPNYAHNDAHQRDGVELKFDLKNLKTDTYEDDHQFRLTVFREDGSVDFVVQESVWDGGHITAACVDSTSSYIVEVAVHTSKAGFNLSDNLMIGMCAQVNDNAYDDGRTACIEWNDDSNEVWQNPSYTGNMTLLAAVAAAPAAVEEAAPAPVVSVETPVVAAPAVIAAPSTGDNALMFVMLAVISLGVIVIWKKIFAR